MVKAGLLLLVLGTGPLIAIIIAAELGLTRDPEPNPIGFGILAMLTFWPSVLLIAIGAFRVRNQGELARGERGSALTEANEPAVADSLRLLARGPLGRGLAGIGGGVLLLRGATSLTVGGRGAAAAMVLGLACLFFAFMGEIPAWFRRGR
jgi:hypothetical protein